MKKVLAAAAMTVVFVAAIAALQLYTEKSRAGEMLDNPLYIGVRNGYTGEYLYISDKEDMHRIIQGIKQSSTGASGSSEGNMYYIDIFSEDTLGASTRYTVDERDSSLTSLLQSFYISSANYRKDRIYLVQNMSAGHNCEIKIRYTSTDGYDSDNAVIAVSSTQDVEEILGNLKDIRFKYDTIRLTEGSNKCWIQVYYNNKQILNEEFSGNKVIRSDEEYIVSNPEVVNNLYSYIRKLEDKRN
ncbi:MAG: hypothetical protein Q8930_16690 [Bacillota bacterium]|nr:hypothetical protein [Bacillota bacterium]